MVTIGSVTAVADDYTGTIRILTVNVKSKIVANDAKKSEGAPDFRVYAGRAEFAAAWEAQTGGEERWGLFERPVRRSELPRADPRGAVRRRWRGIPRMDRRDE